MNTIVNRQKMQKAIDRIHEISDRVCTKPAGQAMTFDDLHAIRVAATAWAEMMACRFKLKSEGQPVSEIDDMDCEQTQVYINDPF